MLVVNAMVLYHNLLDCGMRKLTVGRSIALLIQSLVCYEGAPGFGGKYTYHHLSLNCNPKMYECYGK